MGNLLAETLTGEPLPGEPLPGKLCVNTSPDGGAIKITRLARMCDEYGADFMNAVTPRVLEACRCEEERLLQDEHGYLIQAGSLAGSHICIVR